MTRRYTRVLAAWLDSDSTLYFTLVGDWESFIQFRIIVLNQMVKIALRKRRLSLRSIVQTLNSPYCFSVCMCRISLFRKESQTVVRCGDATLMLQQYCSSNASLFSVYLLRNSTKGQNCSSSTSALFHFFAPLKCGIALGYTTSIEHIFPRTQLRSSAPSQDPRRLQNAS